MDGQLGYIDHALASSPSLFAQVTGVSEWHINSDECPVFDYNNNDSILDAGESSIERESAAAAAFPVYAADALRSSDHDPFRIGIITLV